MDEKQMLARYRAVRLADVSDALDCLGLADRCLMSPRMRPLWEGVRFAGLAHTVKLLPSARVVPAMSYEEYCRTLGEMTDGSYTFAEDVRPDEVIVVDAQGIAAGLFGSDIALSMMQQGVAGMVIDGACRDSREVRMERAPVFATVRTCAHVIGRLRRGAESVPICCAGVTVCPGDVVMGDDDGALVVPRGVAEQAIMMAEDILRVDKKSRGAKYRALGLAPDDSVA